MAKSNTESEDPNLDIPYMDKEAPNRTNFLIDIELPIMKKSSTDMEEPRRVSPYTDKADPSRR
jgi:hypothetical protein